MCTETHDTLRGQIALPPDVALLLFRLRAAGFSAQVVGGCVRDALRGAPAHDWDICTAATPDEVARVFAPQRAIPTGIAHGTVTLVLNGTPYEITTYRADGDYLDHRRPASVAFTHSLTGDLARRDFTVNAMAYSEQEGIVDPFGGRADLAAGVLRCVGNPAQRFAEDALRILRALRFASCLGFALHAETAAAAHAQKDTLRNVSAERVYTELTKLLCGAHVGNVLRIYSDILAVVLPCIAPCIGFAQNSPYHDKDVWLHTVTAVEAAPPDATVRWALLLHDMGKPLCYTQDADGRGHFHGHGAKSAALAGAVMAALRSDAATAQSVENLVRWHDVPLSATPACASRWLRRLGETDLQRLLIIKRCDAMAHTPQSATFRVNETTAFAQFLDDALARNACLTIGQLAVSGSDIMDCGVPQGPAVGNILKQLLAEVLSGATPNEREALQARARTLEARE